MLLFGLIALAAAPANLPVETLDEHGINRKYLLAVLAGHFAHQLRREAAADRGELAGLLKQARLQGASQAAPQPAWPGRLPLLYI